MLSPLGMTVRAVVDPFSSCLQVAYLISGGVQYSTPFASYTVVHSVLPDLLQCLAYGKQYCFPSAREITPWNAAESLLQEVD